jgi:hypothetical protein
MVRIVSLMVHMVFPKVSVHYVREAIDVSAANLTIVSENLHTYDVTSDLARFESKDIFFYALKKRCSLHTMYNAEFFCSKCRICVHN